MSQSHAVRLSDAAPSIGPELATGPEALHHLLEALRERADFLDDALAAGAVRYLERMRDWIADAQHNDDRCDVTGTCHCGRDAFVVRS